MTLYLTAAAITALAWALNVWQYGQRLTPDGRIYSSDAPMPRPYNLRCLVPAMMRHPSWWAPFTSACVIASGPAVAFYFASRGLDWRQSLFGVALWAGLPGTVGLASRYPVLVDAPAHVLTLIAAGLSFHGWVLAAVAVALVGAMVRETVPVWAAVLSLDPFLLVGLVAPAFAWYLVEHAPPPAWLANKVDRPMLRAREAHRGAVLDAREMVLPWGALAVLVPIALYSSVAAVSCVLALALGYAHLTFCHDRSRLYQTGAAAVIVPAVIACPPWMVGLVVLAHWFNPWARIES